MARLLIAWIAALATGAALTALPREVRGRLRRLIALVTRSPARVIAISFLVSFAISAIWAANNGLPLPLIHDEHSRVLQAKTFLEGRLTNPTPAMADHFETFHVLQRPTYTSKYPPADAAMFALGGLLTDHLIVGSWLAIAFGCAAIAWMLAGFVPLRWALFGGLVTAFHSAVLGWSESFMGGGVAMAGGALVVGGAIRTARKPGAWNAILMAIGMALLANSRPWEGLVLTILVVGALTVRIALRPPASWKTIVTRAILPLVIVGGATLAWMGWYDFVVTGHTLRLPYVAYQKTHSRMGLFAWSSRNPDASRTLPPEMLEHQEWELGLWQHYQTLRGALRVSRFHFFFYAKEAVRLVRTTRPPTSWRPIVRAFQYVLVLPLLALPWVIRRRRIGALAAAGIVLFLAGELVAVSFDDQYVAPAVALAAIVFTACFRVLRTIRFRAIPIGRVVANTTLVGMLLMIPAATIWPPRYGATLRRYMKERNAVAARLERMPGKDLVIVHYRPDHDFHIDVVYNGPDLGRAPVIWARDLGAKRNRELVEFEKDRLAWLYEPDETPPRLTPIPPVKR